MSEKLDQVINMLDSIMHPLDSLANFFSEFGTNILISLTNACWDIGLVIGFIGLILYVFGWTKGKNIAFMSPCICIILNIITKVICHA